MSQGRPRAASRAACDVVPLTADRRPELLALWMASRVEAGVSPEVAARSVSESRFLDALARPDVSAHVALLDGVSVGYVVTAENAFGLGLHPEVSIEQLWVDQRVRRHGVARALLTAVLNQADRSRSELIATNVPFQSRDANRFFARLGFSSVVTRRVVATAALRRRIAPVPRAELQVMLRRRLLGATVGRAQP